MISPDASLLLLRMAQDFCAMLLWGGFGYLAFLVPQHLADEISQAVHPAAKWTTALVLAASVAALPIQSASFGEGWADAFSAENLSNILLETPTGTAWFLQVLGSLMAVAALFLANRKASTIIALGGALVLAGRSFIGHGVMLDGSSGVFLHANYLAHLLAAGAWIGALLPFILVVAKSRTGQDYAQALTAIENFSNVGIACVFLILVTGTLNTVFIFGQWPALHEKGFSSWLLVKIVIVTVMVGLALFNRFTLNPKMENAWTDTHKPLAIAAGLECLLGALVLVIVNVFSTMNPH